MQPPPVQYTQTSDGYDIAYAVVGEGRPVVFMPMTMSHLQMYWTEDTWVRPWLVGLSERFQLFQYDSRGHGMSSRGLPKTFRFSDVGRDLEAVILRLGLEKFVLVAVQSFAHIAIGYAHDHPDRVEALILISCPISLADWPLRRLVSTAEEDWDGLLRMQAGLSQAKDINASVQRQKQSITQEDFLAYMRASADSTVAGRLADLNVPTLVLHPRDSMNMPPQESMKLAAAIPNAQMVLIDGATPLGDAAQGIAAIETFLTGLRSNDTERLGTLPASLSQRECEVLLLIVGGRSNQQIADDLIISLNTVRRHISHIFDKTGSANRAEAISFAHRHGLTESG